MGSAAPPRAPFTSRPPAAQSRDQAGGGTSATPRVDQGRQLEPRTTPALEAGGPIARGRFPRATALRPRNATSHRRHLPGLPGGGPFSRSRFDGKNGHPARSFQRHVPQDRSSPPAGQRRPPASRNAETPPPLRFAPPARWTCTCGCPRARAGRARSPRSTFAVSVQASRRRSGSIRSFFIPKISYVRRPTPAPPSGKHHAGRLDRPC